MSLYLQEELWVIVQESERPNAPCPKPLSSGFSVDKAYRVLGLHCPSETSEAYFILCNDRKEVWFISNQHFRVEPNAMYSRPRLDSVVLTETIAKNSINGSGNAPKASNGHLY